MLTEKEAALILYADCKHKGKSITIITSGSTLKAMVVERQIDAGSVCAAIFPRVISTYSLKTFNVLVSPDYSAKLKDFDITVSMGNVTEGYLQDK